MQRISLLRHAKSSHNDTTLSDIDRPLNERGQKDAFQMGMYCSQKMRPPTQIVLSPSLRTRQTISSLGISWNISSLKIDIEDQLYLPRKENFISVINKYGRNSSYHILICAHQPGIEEFAHWLIPDFKKSVPTCTLISILIEAGKIEKNCGKLDLYITPSI